MPSVLLTQCLQRDFVAPLEAHQALPNALHVGREEAERLLGPDPEHGPLAHLMRWARNEPAERLAIVHVRDHHDPTDPRQADHLATFCPHCLAGTHGEELVFREFGEPREDEVIVDAIGLNDFEGTTLPDVLARIAASAPHEPLRVGVVGVWTDAKVTFLLYELRTRLGLAEVATSSALTASASRTQHFLALDQLRRILGVRVFDGVGDFASWLVPDGASVAPVPLPPSSMPALECADASALPKGVDRELVGYLHRHVSRVVLEPLGGGLSGASVFRAQGFDALGHALAPSVVKVGPRDLVAKERVAFEQVEPILGNSAPTVRGFADLGDRAALRYAYASMGSGPVRTFKSVYEGGASDAAIEEILGEVYEGVLGRFHSVAQYERLPLLDYYGFSSRWAGSVRARVAEVAGVDAASPTIVFPGLPARENPARFYEWLDTLPPSGGESHYVAWVHGDLNGANILVDSRENVWLIDFFHAHRGHVLRDLAKLENDILFLMTPLEDDDALREAVFLADLLHGVADLRAPLPETPRGIERPALLRAYRTIRRLRSVGASIVREDRDPHQLRVPLLRYAIHTLSFDEASPRQKRAALHVAAGLATAVRAGIARNVALRVDSVRRPSDRGRLGITLCPGRTDKGRELRVDAATLRADGVRRLFTFVTDDELAWAGVPDLVEALDAVGIAVERLPIPDQRVPTLDEAARVVRRIEESLAAGESVVLACMGGLGRSGMIAALALVAEGLDPDEAIARVREARGPRAVETIVQEDFVRAFAAQARQT